jgi:hypothetical protein
MKNFYKIFRNLKHIEFEPRFRRKLFGVLAFVTAGIALTGVLAIWGLVSVYEKVSALPLKEKAQQELQVLKEGFEHIPPVNAVSCLDQLQSMAGLAPWLEKPMSQNLKQLGNACFPSKAKPCEDSQCV